MTSRALPAACLALAMAAAPAAAPAASWHAPEPLTRSGDAYGASVATGGGALAVAYIRGVGAASRVELRTGTLRGRLGAPVVLRSSPRNAYVTATSVGPDGRAIVAWLRHVQANNRVRATSVRRDGRVAALRTISGAGESAYDPTFLPAADGETYLGWARRSFGQAAPFAGGSFAPLFSSPFTGVGSSATAAVDATGTLVAVWTSGRRVLTAQARAGAPPSTPRELAADGRVPQAAVMPDGTIVATWTTSSGIAAASRPSGGDFGPAAVVAAVPATAARLIAAATGDSLLLVFVDGDRHLRAQRLTPAGRRRGPVVAVGGADETDGVALAGDSSATFAAWSERSTGAVRVARIARDGIFGAPRPLAARSPLRGHPPVVGAGAVEWEDGHGRLLLSRWR